MKKRAVSSLLASLAVVSFILPALAAEAPEYEEPPEESVETEEWSAIRLDGEPVQSVEYEIRKGICYVTVGSFVSMLDPEAMVEEEGGTVTVSATTFVEVENVTEEGETTTANVVDETLDLMVTAGAPYIVANGRYLYAKGSLILLDDSVAAPIRMLAQVFNLSVDYDSEEQTILLDHQEGANAYLTSGGSYYDADTLYWLSRIIYAESGNQLLEGRIAVGNVVMNRVADPLFPNTIYDVLFQKNQFSPASSGSINRTPNEGSVIAAKLVMDGAQVVPTALFFSQAGVSCYASRNRTYVTTIGAHAFYA